MSDDMTPTQAEVWRAVCAMLSRRDTIGPTELGRRTYRRRQSANYHLQTFVNLGYLRRVPIGHTGKRARYARR